MASPTYISTVNIALPASASPGAQNITVPSDATGVLVFWSQWAPNVNDTLLTSLSSNFSDAFTIDQLPSSNLDAGKVGIGVAYARVTSTGSRTITPAWTRTLDAGPTFTIVFVKDIPASGDWVRDTDVRQDTTGGSGTQTGTVSSAADDIVFAYDSCDGATVPSNPTGWTSRATQVGTAGTYDIAARTRTANSPGASTTSATTTGTGGYSTLALASVIGAAGTPTVDEGASTGASFTTVGSYRVATFTGDGTLAVTTGGEFEYLLVGGGGSGGGSDNSYNGGGGGGAGGFKEDSATLAAGTHTIQVGAGGAASGTSTDGNDGEGSAIVGTDSVSGGGGGGMYLNNGRAGASGGGSGGANGTTRTGGTGISGQGYAGGSTTPDPYTGTGAGGGGAGEVGTDSPGFGGGYPPAPGGDGLQSSITGSAVYYAGGGGGGSQGSGATGGLGGGGGGANYISGGVDENGYPGTDGLGGGGGGANGPNKVGGKGGDGIVIIRWIASSGPTVTETDLNSAGAATPTLAAGALADSALAAAGAATPTLAAGALADSALAAAGAATPTLSTVALAAGALASAGAATPTLSTVALTEGALASAGQGAVQASSGATKDATIAPAGSAATSMPATAVAAASFSISGSSEVTLPAAALAPSDMQAAGQASVDLQAEEEPAYEAAFAEVLGSELLSYEVLSEFTGPAYSEADMVATGAAVVSLGANPVIPTRSQIQGQAASTLLAAMVRPTTYFIPCEPVATVDAGAFQEVALAIAGSANCLPQAAQVVPAQVSAAGSVSQTLISEALKEAGMSVVGGATVTLGTGKVAGSLMTSAGQSQLSLPAIRVMPAYFDSPAAATAVIEIVALVGLIPISVDDMVRTPEQRKMLLMPDNRAMSVPATQPMQVAAENRRMERA